jgi:predicted phage terminase large subunit-like protein
LSLKKCPACQQKLDSTAFRIARAKKLPKLICNACVEAQKPPRDPREVLLEAELAARTLARRRLIHFVTRFKANYLPGWVHEDICDRLGRFMMDVEAQKSPRLLLCMPPRHGKSELTSRNFPAWALGHHPDWEIIAASHSQSLAVSFSRALRDMIRDPAYTQLFPDTVLDPNTQSVENWMTTKGGGYMAAGVGTGITGRGAHILIVDDPVKDMEAADSDTIREAIWSWYTSTAYTRLSPGGGVLGIMTLWNDDDWGSRVISHSDSGEGDRFEIVRYPALAEHDEYLTPDYRIIHTPAPDAKPLRKKGEALHPARYSEASLAKIRKNLYASGQQRVWSALYQQNPAPDEGTFFERKMFRYYPSAPRRQGCFIYQAWDFAISDENKGDYTVGATVLQDERDNLYVIDVNRFQSDNGNYIVDTVLDYAQAFNADYLGFEDGQIWKALQAQFELRCRERRQYPSYEILKPLTDKKARAYPLRGRMQAGRVYFNKDAAWFEALYHEFLRFPAGKNDDQVDACSWAVRLALGRNAPTIPSKPEPPSWRDKLRITAETGASHMSA